MPPNSVPDRAPRQSPRGALARGAAVSLLAGISASYVAVAGWRGDAPLQPFGLPLSLLIAALSILSLGLVGELARAPRPAAAAVIVALTSWFFARVAAAGAIPILGDEAYHWLWARELDLCYYDHPGMVAWLARALCPPTIDANIPLRLSPLLLSAALPLLAWRLALDIGTARVVARRAALLCALLPLVTSSFILMPYVPLMFFWTLCCWLTLRALQTRRLTWWILAGLSCGAALNCNFTALLIPATVLGYLIISGRDRIELRRPGFYVAALSAALCLTPILLWNAQNEWATFLFNAANRHAELAFRPLSLLSYLGQLLLWFSPLVLAGWAASAPWQLWRTRTSNARGPLLLICFAAAPLLAFAMTASALKPRGHYAGPALPMVAVLFTLWTHQRPTRRDGESGSTVDEHAFNPARSANDTTPTDPTPVPPLFSGSIHLSAWISASVLVGGTLLPLIPPATVLDTLDRLGTRNPAKRVGAIWGWPSFADALDARVHTRERQPSNSADGASLAQASFGRATPTVILAPSYSQAALLIFYADSIHYAYALQASTSPYGRSFLDWGSVPEIQVGSDALIVWAGTSPSLEENRAHFADRFITLEPLTVGTGQEETALISVLHARALVAPFAE